MNDTPPDDYRRVLVALEAAGDTARLLQLTGRIAAQMHAELAALFVEDVNFLRMAALPFARVIGPSARPQSVTESMIEGCFREAATRLQEALHEESRRLQVATTFQVARGLPVEQAVALARAGDLLVLERISWRHPALARQAAFAAVLCLRAQGLDRPDVRVVYRPGGSAGRTIAAAARLAHALGGRLSVLLPAKAGGIDRMIAEAGAHLAARSGPVAWIASGPGHRELARLTAGAILALPRVELERLAADEDLARAIDAASILIVS